jgi:protocatechuate 3,4-dioxygenase beta subunit
LRPDGLIIYGPRREFEVSDRGCAEVNFYVVDNGRISGRALDLEGRPVANLLVAIVDVDGENVGRFYNKVERTNQEGQYSFFGVPPGRYLIGANTTRYTRADDATNAFPRTYYPGVAEASQATLINLSPGEKVSDRDLRLLPRRTTRAIHLRAVGTDGQPVASATIRFSEVTYHNSGRMNSGAIAAANADEHGQFTIDAYEGQILAIEISEAGDNGLNGWIGGFALPPLVAPIRVTVGSQTDQVKIVVTKVR